MGRRTIAAEPGRAATPLELFFDLVFVTAIAAAATQLHDGVVDSDWGVLGGYLMAFFAIWWAWVNYTWFASAYDNDDVVFRLLTFVIMAGALILAAGIPQLFDGGQSPIAVTGYAVMRLGLVVLWLRAARHDPGRRAIALSYAVGICVVQAFWIARLLIEDERLLVPTFAIGVVAELAVPFIAERAAHTPFNPERGAERSSLLVIIVLGEVVLATVGATQSAIAGDGGDRGVSLDLLLLVVGAFLVVVSLWWLYFRRDHADLVGSAKGVWAFGYLHYLIYAAIAAAGAGITAGVEVSTHHAHVAAQSVEWLVGAAVVTYLMTLSVLHLLGGDGVARTLGPALVLSAAVLAVAAVGPGIGLSVLLMGLALTGGVVAYGGWDRKLVDG
ncbi:low temperature requirement protein A [Janibacter sp. GS2]|uniref:low temperature requirement protein A n=1 Tax=Janibacter sp. GS2 TaxID=3442646 RepID=UPI003EB7B9E4